MTTPKPLPSSVDSEQSVLGGIMLSDEAYHRVADILDTGDFFIESHQLIWRAIKFLSEKGKPVDSVTVGDFLVKRGYGHVVDGGSYLIDLVSNTPSAANIEAYAEIVKDKAILRSVIDAGKRIEKIGFDSGGDEAGDVLATAMQLVFDLAKKDQPKMLNTGVEGLSNTVAEIERRMKAGDALLGMTTTLDDVDEAIGGLQDGDLIILAARPSMGKTAKALQVRRAAAKAGKRPLMFSMEMGESQVYMRDIAAEARVDYGKVQSPSQLDRSEMDRMQEAIARMQEWEWWLDTTPALTVDKIVARIRRMHALHGIGIVVIDYLQFIDLQQDKGVTTATAVQNVTRKLKAVAKELRIPIVLLSQLNRGLESRADKRPIMSDLRESGAIEQDADVIIFLHREGYYEKNWAEDDPRQNVVEVIIGKARTGRVGSHKATWLGRYQRFENLSYYDIPPEYIEMEKRREQSAKGNQRSSRGFQPHSAIGAGIERTAGGPEPD